MEDQREEEVRRQALFREVNEQIEKLSDGWELFDGSISVLCECGRPGCNEALEVSRKEFSRQKAATVQTTSFGLAYSPQYLRRAREAESGDERD